MSSIFARISKLSEKKRKRMKRRQGNSRTNQLETLHRDETLVKYVKYSTLHNVKAVFDFAVIHKYLIGRREIELRIIYLAEENMVLERSADKYFLWLKKVNVKRLRARIYLMIKGTYLIYVRIFKYKMFSKLYAFHICRHRAEKRIIWFTNNRKYY